MKKNETKKNRSESQWHGIAPVTEQRRAARVEIETETKTHTHMFTQTYSPIHRRFRSKTF